MENRCYLAMTAAEFQNCSSIPAHSAWLSCHFSPYTKGLSNVPGQLPPGAMVILDDANPVYGHDPEAVRAQLDAAVKKNQCSCVLLDFQKPGNEETAAMAAYLGNKLSCPVGISHLYANEMNCAVLLPPIPPDVPLAEYIQPWAGREIWLELAMDVMGCRITKNGAVAFQPTSIPSKCLTDTSLCCHYATEIYDDYIDFTLWRTAEDLTLLMEQAEKCGISQFVGLWQELHQ